MGLEQNADMLRIGVISDTHGLLRPEALEVVLDSAGPGAVTDRTFLGSAVRLEVTLDSGQKVLVESSSLSTSMKLGDRIAMRILADSVVVA